MTFKLSGVNRITLYSVVPFHGNTSPLNQGMFEELREDIQFNEKEASNYPDIEAIEVDIEDWVNKFICNELTRILGEGHITPEQMELYKIFVGG
jgi:hypothetical protein